MHNFGFPFHVSIIF